MAKEYLTIDEVCARIKFSKQSIYNLISKGTLKHRVHYYKPTRKKLLFDWSAMTQWVETSAGSSDAQKKQPCVEGNLSFIKI